MLLTRCDVEASLSLAVTTDMHRSKPFSGKAKKAQLQAKRALKREQRGGSRVDDDTAADASAAAATAAALTCSLGKSGTHNKWSTVFAREENAAVERRRYAAALPLNTSRRGRVPVARQPPLLDPVLAHPRGVLLRGHAADRVDTPSLVRYLEDAHAIEQRAFDAWLERVYERYQRDDLNYFEHNLEVWMQLWHTLATADVIVIVADVRNPLWHVPPSLMEQVTHELRKPVVILLNKVDLVPQSHVDLWLGYLRRRYPTNVTIIPFSASGAPPALGLGDAWTLASRRRKIREARGVLDHAHVSRRIAAATSLLTAVGAPYDAVQVVVERLAATERRGRVATEREARAFEHEQGLGGVAAVQGDAAMSGGADDQVEEDDQDDDEEEMNDDKEDLGGSGDEDGVDAGGDNGHVATDLTITHDEKAFLVVDEQRAAPTSTAASVAKVVAAPVAAAPVTAALTVGMVGHPNVGKSSVINCLAGEKRVSVSRTAGHTKRAQTIPLAPGLHLLDCPGLVFPHSLRGDRPDPVVTRVRSDEALRERTNGSDELAAVTSTLGIDVAAAAADAAPARARRSVGEDDQPPPARVVFPRARGAVTSRRGGEGNDVPMAAAPTGFVLPPTEEERAMQELCGVIPLAQVREPYTAVRYLAEVMPVERMYGLSLPKDEDAWSPLLLCEALASKRGQFIAHVGRPDAHSAGREILYDVQDGVVPLAWLPPAE